MLFNVFQIPALVLSAVIALVSIIAWRNDFIFQRYQFSVGAIRYHKQYVRLISSAFLHANGWHLFFNLFTLYFFFLFGNPFLDLFSFHCVQLFCSVFGNAHFFIRHSSHRSVDLCALGAGNE